MAKSWRYLNNGTRYEIQQLRQDENFCRIQAREYGSIHVRIHKTEKEEAGEREMTTEQKIQYIADHYGYEPQSRQLIEEMAELTVAINKACRKTLDTVDKIPNMDDEERIEEEIVDVLIMIWQIKYLLGIGEGELSHIMEQKLDRQIERIKNGC